MADGVRSMPCTACPYRRDVASGVWSEEEYAKLEDYDAPTHAQPIAVFCCHATPEHICHGWAVVHTSRGNEYDLLALRIRGADYSQIPEPGVPLFESGHAAAEHGRRDIDEPSPDAIETVSKLMTKHPRLRDQPEVMDVSDLHRWASRPPKRKGQ